MSGTIPLPYDFLAEQESLVAGVYWDLTVFEEATALSTVYMQDNKKASALKRIAKDSCKLLLTGMPIEKNIMDLYGPIYFIDETIFPAEQEFLQRYLRRPENYPELSAKIGKYCFRTLRSQAKEYAQIPDRIPITYEYSLSKPEQELYNKLFAYCQKEHSIAFPEMNAYDLRLLGLLGSSTAAMLQTLRGIIERIAENPLAVEEVQQLREMEQLAQSYLYRILSPKYSAALYNGTADYTAINLFKNSAQILLSTDLGARGFKLEECSLVVQYDLLYNTLKMEQRIDRFHRLRQKSDVVVLSFIDKNNFSDVCKLELVNKRMLVADGVLGLSDEAVGGFTDDLDGAFDALGQKLRNR